MAVQNIQKMFLKSASVIGCLGLGITVTFTNHGIENIQRLKQFWTNQGQNSSKMNIFYKVKVVEGKQFGCVASKDIKKGTIILKEKPQCIANWSGSRLKKFENVIEAFNKMSKSDQDDYLKLYNKFTESQTLNSEIKDWIKNNHDISNAKASSIVGIYISNFYEMGVGISKSSHSALKWG